MVCGVPAIRGRASGTVPWTLSESELGILCDVRDPNEFATAILSAINCNEETYDIAQCGFTSVKERFNM
jgi:glycosyltransferase involved in cell wall biosynthesis